jgi:hypothetical protein
MASYYIGKIFPQVSLQARKSRRLATLRQVSGFNLKICSYS